MIARFEQAGIPWWVVLLQGIAAVILGLLLLSAPAMTMVVLVRIVGIYWFVSGIFSIVAIFIDSTMWGWKLLAGLLGIIAGLIVLEHPLWSPFVVGGLLIIILGVEGLLIGLINLYQSFKGGGWGIGVLGALNVLVGIVLLANPLQAIIALPFVVGVLGLAFGIVAILAAFQMR